MLIPPHYNNKIYKTSYWWNFGFINSGRPPETVMSSVLFKVIMIHPNQMSSWALQPMRLLSHRQPVITDSVFLYHWGKLVRKKSTAVHVPIRTRAPLPHTHTHFWCINLHHKLIQFILTGISEQPDLRKGILKQGLKKHWDDFYHYRMDVYTSNTYLCSNNL